MYYQRLRPSYCQPYPTAPAPAEARGLCFGEVVAYARHDPHQRPKGHIPSWTPRAMLMFGAEGWVRELRSGPKMARARWTMHCPALEEQWVLRRCNGIASLCVACGRRRMAGGARAREQHVEARRLAGKRTLDPSPSAPAESRAPKTSATGHVPEEMEKPAKAPSRHQRAGGAGWSGVGGWGGGSTLSLHMQ